MYIFNRILHTNSEVVSVYIKLDIPTEFEVKSLTDLPNLKNLIENQNSKNILRKGNELFQTIREKFDMKLLLVSKHN